MGFNVYLGYMMIADITAIIQTVVAVVGLFLSVYHIKKSIISNNDDEKNMIALFLVSIGVLFIPISIDTLKNGII